MLDKPKIGLNLPLNKWFKEKKLLGRYLDMLLDDTTRKRGIYNAQYLDYMVNMQKAGTMDFSKRLIILIVFELWHRIFFDKRKEAEGGIGSGRSGAGPQALRRPHKCAIP